MPFMSFYFNQFEGLNICLKLQEKKKSRNNERDDGSLMPEPSLETLKSKHF